MGMGVGWDIYPRSGIHAGSISICQGSTLAIQFGRNLDIGFALPISADYPVVFVAELDDFSVLIATVALAFLAVYQKGQAPQSSSSSSH